ncbi:MAG: alpha/beta hydrolase family protein [Cytophagaceae bacterium]
MENVDIIIRKVKKEPKPGSRVSNLSISLVQGFYKSLSHISPEVAAYLALENFMRPKRYKERVMESEIIRMGIQYKLPFLKGHLQMYEWKNKGPYILLVHGWDAAAANLAAFIPELINMGYSVLAFDAPAHGNSSGEKTNIIEYGTAISAVYKFIQPKAIIAHSFGGSSTMFAIANQDFNPEKLISISAPSNLAEAVKRYTGFIQLTETAEEKVFERMRTILGTDPGNLQVENIAQKLPNSSLVIVHDRFDPVIPFYEAENVYKVVRPSRFLITENFGHYKIVNDPEAIKKILEYL